MRIILNEKDFKNLINGKTIEKDGVQIILEDIGYFQMLNIVKDEIQNYIKDNNEWED